MRALVLSAIAAAALGSAVAVGVRPADALPGPAVLYVSGLHVDGNKVGAYITLTNTSTSNADFYTVTCAFLHEDGRAAAPPVELPLLLDGRSVTIPVHEIVDNFREDQQVSPFKGPIQVVVRGTSCADTETCPVGQVPQPFGPDVIQVDARQTEGSATYDAAWTWSALN